MGDINKKELHDIFIGIKNGNEIEFNKLYDKYNALVYKISLHILKNKDNAEEIVQEVFLKIFKLEKEKLPNKNEASWLYSLTKNSALNLLRKKKENIDIDQIYYITEECKELNQIIEKDTYNKIISKLDKREQEIVSLRVLSDLSFKDIAKVLNIPIGTVQWKYYKAMYTLKTLISSFIMYIVTTSILIKQKVQNKKQENEEKLEEQPKETEKKKEESVSKDEIGNMENITQSTIVSDIENQKMTQEDIGLVGISSVFLIITLTFLFFFIISQQKSRKKVSKL